MLHMGKWNYTEDTNIVLNASWSNRYNQHRVAPISGVPRAFCVQGTAMMS